MGEQHREIGTSYCKWIFKTSSRYRETLTLFRYLNVTLQFHWDRQQSTEHNFVNVREHYRTNCWLIEAASLCRHLLPLDKLIWHCGTLHNCTPVIVQEDIKLTWSAERHETMQVLAVTIPHVELQQGTQLHFCQYETLFRLIYSWTYVS
jgi:hypothetical protein